MSRKLTCHCGAVELRVTLAEPLANAARCDCSFCRRRGAATVAVALDALQVVRGTEVLTLYQWGSNTAKHYFCAICGIYTHHQRRSNPNQYGVNIGGLDGVNPRALQDIAWTDGVNHPSDAGPAQ